MSHQPAKLSVEERLEAIRKSLRAKNVDMTPDFNTRTAELDPKTRQLLRSLDAFAGPDPKE